MTRCSRITSADENTVLSWPIANVSFLWRTGRGERGSKNWVPAPHGVVMIKLIVWGSLKRWVQSNAWWQCGTSLAAMFVHHCGVTIVERGNPVSWRKTSLPWRPKQCLLLPSSLLQNRWGCQPMADLCLRLFYSCRGTSWPMFNIGEDPPGGFVCSLWSSGQQLQKCRSVLLSRDILCDLGQPKVLALLLGNNSHLRYKIQHEFLDHVIALINRYRFWGRRNHDLILACSFQHKDVILIWRRCCLTQPTKKQL